MNEQNSKPNNRKLGGFLRRGASRLTLGLGSSTLILAVTTAIALVAVSTVAWLSVNRNVDSGTAAMDMDSELFELGVPSENGVKNPRLTNANWTAGQKGAYDIISDTWLRSWLGGLGFATGEDDILTSKDKTGIVCSLVIDSGDDALRPGSHGHLDFYITPKKDGLRFTASMEQSALGKMPGDKYERLDDTYFVQNDTDARKPAFGYLKGHILFFTAYQIEQDATISYSGQILPGEAFLIDGAQHPGTPYRVRIYWEWPITYERLKEMLGEDEITGEHRSWYFHEQETLSSSLEEFNMAYNNADTEIGKHISHIGAEISVHVENETVQLPTVTAQAE